MTYQSSHRQFEVTPFEVSIEKIEQIFLLERHAEFIQYCLVFLSEGLLLMMPFLIDDVGDDVSDLRSRIRKNTVAVLPIEFSWDPFLFINELVAFDFNFLDEICN